VLWIILPALQMLNVDMEMILTQLNRIIKAARMGFIWRGTSRFDAPNQFRWLGRNWAVSIPEEEAIKGVFRGVILDDEYGLQSLKNAPQTIVDVGANVGLFSVWARANFPKSVIHSYEPNPAIQSFLAANCAEISAFMFEEAVAACDGSVALKVRPGGSVGGRCALEEVGPISVTSLRNAVARIGGTCDLLKLDCEGAEWDMLKDPTAFDAVKSVRMEYHLFESDQSVDSLVASFEAMGFRMVRLVRDPERGLAWFDRV